MTHFLWRVAVNFFWIGLGILLYYAVDGLKKRKYHFGNGMIKRNYSKKYSGTMICGTNHETGTPVYRVEFDIPLEDIPKNKKLVLRVVHTDENLGINQRLYDLESEGIRHDD